MSDEPEAPYYETPEEEGAAAPTTARGKKREAARKAKERIDRRIETARAILSQPAGREFLAWLLHDVAALHQATETPSFSDAAAHFRAGQRDVALNLHRLLLGADKVAYMTLLSEHMD